MQQENTGRNNEVTGMHPYYRHNYRVVYTRVVPEIRIQLLRLPVL